MSPAGDLGYPNSYYAASRILDLSFPALHETVNTDVCVVGGGFSGLATALFLKERGLEVVLLESARIGWGASGRNGGHVVSAYGEETEHIVAGVHGVSAGQRAYDLGFECIRILTEVIDRHQIDCDLTWGYLRAAITNRQVATLRSVAQEFEARNPSNEPRLAEGTQVGELVGSNIYKAALYTKSEEHLHPLNLALGEAQAISRLGGRIFENSAVTQIEYGDTSKIITQTGQIHANTVVLCGNAYLGRLEPRLQKTLIPGYSAIIATEPLPADLRATMIPGNAAVSDMRTVLDYYRFSADGRMLWGGLGHWSGADAKHPEHLLKKRMLKVFPELSSARIDFRWSGRIGVSVNLNPQIGRLAPNVYYAQAYSGHGVASTHLSGHMIAEAITSGSDDFEMFAGIPHMAVPVNDCVHRLARAWGMNSRRMAEWF